jgi:hypothetical protein
LEAIKYLDVVTTDAKITIKTTEQFVKYEQDEVRNQYQTGTTELISEIYFQTTSSFTNILVLTCADATTRTLVSI